MIQLADSLHGQFERLPPHDIGAEMCVIAAMILDKEVRGEIVQMIDRDAFFQADHQLYFDVITSLDSAGRSIDAVVVRGEMEKRQLFEEVGGHEYLVKILGSIPSPSHGPEYARRVVETCVQRQLIAAGNDILRDAYAPCEDVQVLLDRAENKVFAIADRKIVKAITPMVDALEEVFDQLEHRGQRGLETGFFDLDDLLNGLQNGEMIVIAARPSIGKTALAMNIVEGVAADRGVPAMVFSMEMSKQQLAQRVLCSRGHVDSHRLRRGMLQSDEFTKLANVVAGLSKAPIYVDDSPTLTPMDLRAKARRAKSMYGVGLIIIDYMQLMDASTTKESRQQQITEISRGIKAVARELNVPVVALSQLNRQSESREGHRPRMSDLRESGAIEQDADVIMLLHREDYYRVHEPDFQPDNIAEVIVAKQRNGPTGTVKLFFNNRCTRFENLAAAELPY